MKYKVVLQPDAMLCGVACLSTICAYYGMNNMSLSVIRNFAQTDREGNTVKSLCIAADKLHMEAKGIKCPKSAFIAKKIQTPAIVHTLIDGLYNHYMVLFEATDKKVVLGDPSQGQIEMKWEEFEKIWTNVVICIKPTENFSENKKYKRNYKFLFNLLKKFRTQIIIMGILTTILSGVIMVGTWFYSYLIDYLIPQNQFPKMIVLIVGVSIIYIFTMIIGLLKEKYNIKFNKELDKELIINIYNRITELPISFFSMRTLGDIQARYQDGDSLRETIMDFSLGLLIEIGYAIWAIFLILKISWEILLLVFTIITLTLIFHLIYQKRIKEGMKKSFKTAVDVESYVIATFEANETIKNYTSEKAVERKMADRYSKYQSEKYKTDMNIQKAGEIIGVIQRIGQIFILGVLAMFVMRGDITIGQLVACYTYIYYVFTPISSLSEMKDQLIETSAVLERLEDVFRIDTEEEIDKKKVHLVNNIEKIEFDNVVFQYGLKKPVLNGISFDIKKGETIGIIGESGCGKTTLIKLIMGFYDATEGIISINDSDIKAFTKKSIRRKIAYVSQEDYWFQDTIYNNLSIGKENVSEEDLNRICQMVKIDEFIASLPYGFNSMIEEGGVNLSSGQRQRLSIAKALITKPDVLILDESTANLDADTEAYVVEQLRRETNKIKIIVAHRLNTLIHCNKIISIKDGLITEVGSPQELLKQDGMFKKLWLVQNRAFDSITNN